MNNYQPLNVLPAEFQEVWQAELVPARDHPAGAFRLVAIRRTDGGGSEGQRITVLLIDENGQALPGIPVAFSFSTARQYTLTQEFTWRPPSPRRADVFSTKGSGQIDHIQGSVVQGGPAWGCNCLRIIAALRQRRGKRVRDVGRSHRGTLHLPATPGRGRTARRPVGKYRGAAGCVGERYPRGTP